MNYSSFLYNVKFWKGENFMDSLGTLGVTA